MTRDRLKNCALVEDGARVRLGFEDRAGWSHVLSLPIAVLNGLMMTVRGMLQYALEAQLVDNSLRMLHRLGDGRIEKADALVACLATLDGFDVAFAMPAAMLCPLVGIAPHPMTLTVASALDGWTAVALDRRRIGRANPRLLEDCTSTEGY